MRNPILAALLAVAAIAAHANTAEAGSGNYVWHHSSPVYVGKATKIRTHGTTVGTTQSRVLRNWYSPRKNVRHSIRHFWSRSRR
jgi:hypothetical protein